MLIRRFLVSLHGMKYPVVSVEVYLYLGLT